jgi:hypothetical protein
VLVVEIEENLKEIHQGRKAATKTGVGSTLEGVPRDISPTCRMKFTKDIY